MSNIRSQAEIVYNASSPLSYETVCEDADITRLMTAVGAAAASITDAPVITDATAGSATTITCHDNVDAYAVSSALVLTDGTQRYFCVDSSGNAKTGVAVLAASSYTCP